MRRVLGVVVIALAAASAAHAQIIRPVRSTNPIVWTSLSVGWFQHQALCDPDSDACWNFGGGPQFRGTVEIPVGRGASLGLAGTMARVPLVYAGQAFTERSCSLCDADANISQLFADFRLGGSGSSSLHQVIDLYAGYTFFHNFRATDGTPLGSRHPVNDITFGLGYGFGFSLSPRSELYLVQDLALLIHERQSGSAQNTAQQSTTRIGFRYGLGSR